MLASRSTRSAATGRALRCAAVFLFSLSVIPTASATNGYFAHGYGTKAKAIAGAGAAYPQDGLIAATNPAGMVHLGQHFYAGMAVFSPRRQYTVIGSPTGFPGTFGLAPGRVQSNSEYFLIPAFAYNRMLNSDSSLGVSVYGNGGMNTDYPTATFYATSPTGIDMSQLFINTTYARRLSERHSFGVSLIFAVQFFEAKGIASFADFSSAPTKLSNNGRDSSTGWGAKIGYMGQWAEGFTVGASYQTVMSMSKFDKYSGLFAEQGGFDIPSTWTVGFALRASESVDVVVDVQRTNFSDAKSVGNPMFPAFGNIFLGDMSSLLGGNNGVGFGWQDMTTYKVGLVWKAGEIMTWRFGYSRGDQPIPESEVFFNILAPGVMEEHLTVGFSRAFADGREFNLALMYAPTNSVTGPNPLEAPGAQFIELSMNQWELDMSYTRSF